MEILDICNEEGIPTGKTVDRETAHREAIRHRTAHVWIMRNQNGRIQVLLQKRSMTFGELQDEIVGSFCLKSRESSKGACRHILHEVRELLKNGIIIGLRS